MIIVNLKKELVKFWQQAESLCHNLRVDLWNSTIEANNEKLFQEQVWRSSSRENWEEFKSEKLRETFEFYEENFLEIAELFDDFERVLTTQCKKYAEVFPDSDFSKTPFYVMPSCMTFNGRGGSNSDYPDQNVMYIGIDYICKRNDDLDLFFSHELFHLYHIDRMGVNEKVFMEEGRLTLPLWLEGLATYVSGVVCPGKSVSELLMDDNFKDINAEKYPEVAQHFSKVANEKINHNEMKTYQSLFNFQTEPFIEDLPARIGYFLGYHVVKDIVADHELKDVVSWDHEKVHQEVVKKILN
jgi:uncharacterized protein YjaZ